MRVLKQWVMFSYDALFKGLVIYFTVHFASFTGLIHQDNCTDCSGGMACDQQGLTYPLNPCSPGYYCRYGAQTTTPNQGAQADVCPAGSYCPEGTADPVPCPEGSFSPTAGLHMESQCTNCTGGYYCNETGNTLLLERHHEKTNILVSDLVRHKPGCTAIEDG